MNGGRWLLIGQPVAERARVPGGGRPSRIENGRCCQTQRSQASTSRCLLFRRSRWTTRQHRDSQARRRWIRWDGDRWASQLATRTTSAPRPCSHLTFPALPQAARDKSRLRMDTQGNPQHPCHCRETQEPLARQPEAPQPQD